MKSIYEIQQQKNARNSQRNKIKDTRRRNSNPFKYGWAEFEMELNGKRVPFNNEKRDYNTKIFLHGREVKGSSFVGNLSISKKESKHEKMDFRKTPNKYNQIKKGYFDYIDDLQESWYEDDEYDSYNEVIFDNFAEKAERIYLDNEPHDPFDNMRGYQSSIDERYVDDLEFISEEDFYDDFFYGGDDLEFISEEDFYDDFFYGGDDLD